VRAGLQLVWNLLRDSCGGQVPRQNNSLDILHTFLLVLYLPFFVDISKKGTILLCYFCFLFLFNLNFIPSGKIDAFINQRPHQLNSLLIDWFGGSSEIPKVCQPKPFGSFPFMQWLPLLSSPLQEDKVAGMDGSIE
jgi:hypothetical protein